MSAPLGTSASPDSPWQYVRIPARRPKLTLTLSQAIAFYLTLWYLKGELAKRVGLFISAGSVAGAFSGLIAYGVGHIDSKLAAWRILFLVEVRLLLRAVLPASEIFSPESCVNLTLCLSPDAGPPVPRLGRRRLLLPPESP